MCTHIQPHVNSKRRVYAQHMYVFVCACTYMYIHTHARTPTDTDTDTDIDTDIGTDTDEDTHAHTHAKYMTPTILHTSYMCSIPQHATATHHYSHLFTSVENGILQDTGQQASPAAQYANVDSNTPTHTCEHAHAQRHTHKRTLTHNLRLSNMRSIQSLRVRKTNHLRVCARESVCVRERKGELVCVRVSVCVCECTRRCWNVSSVFPLGDPLSKNVDEHNANKKCSWRWCVYISVCTRELEFSVVCFSCVCAHVLCACVWVRVFCVSLLWFSPFPLRHIQETEHA